MQALKVGLLGASGVGKTSLMAAMWQTLERESSPVRLRPNDPTRSALHKKWSEFVDANAGEAFRPPAGGMAGSAGFTKHTFTLRVAQEDAAVVTFVDHRGGDLADNHSVLRGELQDAVAILVVVDAVVLDQWPEEAARAELAVTGVKEIFEGMDDQAGGPPQVTFVLTKAERYFEDNALANLRARFESVFRPAVDALRDRPWQLVAVQTTGRIRLSRVETEEVEGRTRRRAVFTRLPGDIEPKYADVPLRLTTRHLLRTVLREKGWLDAVMDWWKGVTARQRAALEEFGADDRSPAVLRTDGGGAA